MVQDKVMTLEEAATYGGYALETIKILVKNGIIPSYTPEGDELIERTRSEGARPVRGAHVVVKASELDTYKARTKKGRPHTRR